MNIKDINYSKFALVREMLETASIISNFDPKVSERFVKSLKSRKGLFLTGEGSSRIFPARRAIYSSMKKKFTLPILTDGCTQAMEYNLEDFTVFAASNSGQTKEVIRMVIAHKNKNHKALFGLTANKNTKLQELADDTHILSCGKEDAVAATKSVVEQCLFYDSLLRNYTGDKMDGLKELAEKTEQAMTAKIDSKIIGVIKKADLIYFAGRDNGVAAELALKTNEITRKKSAFLEGTFALHGIEEVMNRNEVLIWIDPFMDDQEKFRECLVKGAGIDVIAVSDRQTIFPTILIPDGGQYAEYVQIAAGWNILVEAGIALGINLDKPRRARKVGNEYIGG